MSSKRKGKDRERQAEKLYQSAGYKTEIVRGLRWGRTDWFGVFDVMAVKPDEKVRFCQVKSNRASGINSWLDRTSKFIPPDHVTLDFLVCHDYKGWRLLQPDGEGFTATVDERDMDCNMGDGVAQYLRGVE